ncbi:MAG: ABC transporter substrate-binding protein [Acutalibacter sp.]|nr:ABC transporter substrate-binding protein [Acutalibacter sp.]
MDQLLDQYGQGIRELLGGYLAATTVNGKIYTVPTIRDLCRGAGINYDVELAQECEVDMSQVKELSDLTPVFEQIQAVKGKDFPCLVNASVGSSFLKNYIIVDALNDSNGVLMNFGLDNTDVTFFEETEVYKEMVTLLASWFKAGYVQKDIVISQEDKYTMLRQNLGFCYPTNCKPGIANTASLSVGRLIANIQMEDYFATTAQVASFNFSLAQGCIDQAKAMEFLNALYTDGRIATLLGRGIEGQHYQVLENGQIRFPEGVDQSNCTFFPNVTWAVGNQFATPVWENDPEDIWEQQAAANDSAHKSLALGFTFDNSKVASEVSAVTNVRNEYQNQIENGDCDVDALLPQYIQALRSAGIETIIQEKQTQLNHWLANQ